MSRNEGKITEKEFSLALKQDYTNVKTNALNALNNVGSLGNLKTNAKNNTVAAINELFQYGVNLQTSAKSALDAAGISYSNDQLSTLIETMGKNLGGFDNVIEISNPFSSAESVSYDGSFDLQYISRSGRNYSASSLPIGTSIYKANIKKLLFGFCIKKYTGQINGSDYTRIDTNTLFFRPLGMITAGFDYNQYSNDKNNWMQFVNNYLVEYYKSGSVSYKPGYIDSDGYFYYIDQAALLSSVTNWFYGNFPSQNDLNKMITYGFR